MDSIPLIIKETLEGDDRIKLCILYGSAASGKLTLHSDIDIAVAGNAKFGIDALVELQLKLSHNLGYEVDLVDLKDLEGFILSEILKHGIVLIKKETAFYAELIKKVIYFKEDILPGMRMILHKRARRFAGGK